MYIIVAKYLIPKGYRGLTVFPFVIIKHRFDSENQTLINHERIHIRQQLELLVLPFFVWYFVEYAVRLLQYRNANLAYKNISFEREAYANEKHVDYLKNRTLFSFLKYV
ncbi:hypothetical protein [Flavobacterium marginilacus]|uniref:hypothetical protein n=1 Tax=Flavobacterium marginilacus TaxID=3003256 RepID=UPI00248F3B7A|nr:hypothetical protein [Flavobacterium marginilacus]